MMPLAVLGQDPLAFYFAVCVFKPITGGGAHHRFHGMAFQGRNCIAASSMPCGRHIHPFPERGPFLRGQMSGWRTSRRAATTARARSWRRGGSSLPAPARSGNVEGQARSSRTPPEEEERSAAEEMPGHADIEVGRAPDTPAWTIGAPGMPFATVRDFAGQVVHHAAGFTNEPSQVPGSMSSAAFSLDCSASVRRVSGRRSPLLRLASPCLPESRSGRLRNRTRSRGKRIATSARQETARR